MSAGPSAGGSLTPGIISAGTVLGLLIGYGLGYFHAAWRRARSDYVKTKALLPGLRSVKWDTWRTMVRRGAIVLAVLLALIIWLVSAATGPLIS